jgi:hypothetical protein
VVAVTGPGATGPGPGPGPEDGAARADGAAAVVDHLARHLDGLLLLRIGAAAGGAQPRRRGAPSVDVIAAPTSDELVQAWNLRPTR